MKQYDYLIAGGGAAGLGLAYQMASSSLRGQSMLIVDREAKDSNDHTWSFWTDRPTAFDHLVFHRWHRAEVVGDHFKQTYDLTPYTYQMIRAIDYYQGLHDVLSSVPGVEFLQARVKVLKDYDDHSSAMAIINQDDYYSARWAFDSTFAFADYAKGPLRYHYLKRHFKGWEIETASDCFDPSTVTLFDFRIPQNGSLRFFQVFPMSPRRALIEFTLFSVDTLKPHEYDRAIGEYLEKIRQIEKYRIAAVQTGVIPMTDQPFERQLGARVMAVGTRGGLVKPSTGDAFMRIQKDSASIVHSLQNFGTPFRVPSPSPRYQLIDSLWLQLIYRRSDRMKDILIQMFEKNTIQDIFRFLDESAPLINNLSLLTSLPTAPFLKALFRVKLLRKV